MYGSVHGFRATPLHHFYRFALKTRVTFHFPCFTRNFFRHAVTRPSGFTFACRIESAKVKIEKVLQKFENQQHFSPELFKGSRVSCASDVYAYGYLLQLILKFSMYELEETMEIRLKCIVGHCLKRNPAVRLPHIFLSDRLKAILSL